MSILGKRERQVLEWVSLGYEDKQIAALQGVSVSTVRNQLRDIREKLDARNSVHAVRIAIEKGELNVT